MASPGALSVPAGLARTVAAFVAWGALIAGLAVTATRASSRIETMGATLARIDARLCRIERAATPAAVDVSCPAADPTPPTGR